MASLKFVFTDCEKAHQIPYMTFNNHRKAMLEAGLIEIPGGKSERGRRIYYTVSKKGEELLG